MIGSQQLEHFLAVYKAGSLGKACREIGISQPALSKSLRRLEDQLGVELFERRPTGVKPSAYADALARRAELVHTELTRAVEDVANLRDGQEGEARLGVGPAIAGYFLPKLLGRLLAERPGLRITVLEGLYEALAEHILSGTLDLAVTTRPAVALAGDLRSETLVRERFVVAAGRDHPLCARDALTAEDLTRCPWVLPPRRGILWPKIVDLFVRHGVVAPQPTVETDSSGLMKGLLRHGPFLTFLPERLLQPELNGGEMRVLDVPGFVVERELIALSRAGAILSPATRLILVAFKRDLADAHMRPCRTEPPGRPSRASACSAS